MGANPQTAECRRLFQVDYIIKRVSGPAARNGAALVEEGENVSLPRLYYNSCMSANPINPEMVRGLATSFPRRREAAYQWGRAISQLQALPGIRSLWAGGLDGSNQLVDLINAQNMTFAGNAQLFYRGLIPYIELPGGASDSVGIADAAALDLLGTETQLAPALRGATVGVWFQLDDLGSGDNYILAKWDAATATDGSYCIFQNSSNLTFRVTNGTTNYDATLTGVITAGEWAFAAGRFDPSADVYVHHNLQSNAAGSAPASINNSTVALRLGARSSNADQIDGRVALAFLSAAFLPAFYLEAIYHWTRDLFNA